MLRFDERVVVVTGAGNGLGRSHALDFARRGARVVVNDLGGGTGGAGDDRGVSGQVAREIVAAGGEAVANSDSVEHGERIIEQAMDTYGRVDVLVNNAGILRDRAFHKMTDEDWDLVYSVHLLGAFRTTRAAWAPMRAAGYGRVLMTTSAAGVYGNFGQANYSAAKLGIVGLAETLAIEGASKGILVNAIAPIAASRLTAGVMPPAMLEALSPAYVTPLAVRLCHETSSESGALFEVGGGWVGKVRWERSRGAVFDPETLDGEGIDARWEDIVSFANATHPSSIQDTLGLVADIVGVPLLLAKQ